MSEVKFLHNLSAKLAPISIIVMKLFARLNFIYEILVFFLLYNIILFTYIIVICCEITQTHKDVAVYQIKYIIIMLLDNV